MLCAYTRPGYQVSVYRTIGPLVLNYPNLSYLNLEMQYNSASRTVVSTVRDIADLDYFGNMQK